MANVALEVAAAAFGKNKKNQRNLFQKSGIGQNGCFSTARSVLYPTTLFSSRCKKWRHSAERVVPFSVAGAVLAQESVVFPQF